MFKIFTEKKNELQFYFVIMLLNLSLLSIIVYYATREKKFILRMWSLMPVQSECNNHTNNIDVIPVLHTIFFPLEGQKMDLFEKLIYIKYII